MRDSNMCHVTANSKLQAGRVELELRLTPHWLGTGGQNELPAHAVQRQSQRQQQQQQQLAAAPCSHLYTLLLTPIHLKSL
jgi:hypothetical protein